MNTRTINLKDAAHTQVHITDDGYIGIEQHPNHCGHTAVVKLTPDQATLLIDELRLLVQDKATWWEPAWEDTRDAEPERRLEIPLR